MKHQGQAQRPWEPQQSFWLACFLRGWKQKKPLRKLSGQEGHAMDFELWGQQWSRDMAPSQLIGRKTVSCLCLGQLWGPWNWQGEKSKGSRTPLQWLRRSGALPCVTWKFIPGMVAETIWMLLSGMMCTQTWIPKIYTPNFPDTLNQRSIHITTAGEESPAQRTSQMGQHLMSKMKPGTKAFDNLFAYTKIFDNILSASQKGSPPCLFWDVQGSNLELLTRKANALLSYVPGPGCLFFKKS